jgi:hypothetical protein
MSRLAGRLEEAPACTDRHSRCELLHIRLHCLPAWQLDILDQDICEPLCLQHQHSITGSLLLRKLHTSHHCSVSAHIV